MVIGMLGGSFCPPTKAHLELSKKCIEDGLCDKVIWVPVNEAYKKATNISAKHRIEMVKLALEGESNITYSLHEQDFAEIIRTFQSIQELQKIYPNDKILFIAGADKLGFKWMQKEEFVKNFGYILINRGDINCEDIINKSSTLSKWKKNIKMLNFDSDISSTLVRGEIKNNGESLLISPSVQKYIKDNKLFI